MTVEYCPQCQLKIWPKNDHVKPGDVAQFTAQEKRAGKRTRKLTTQRAKVVEVREDGITAVWCNEPVELGFNDFTILGDPSPITFQLWGSCKCPR